MRGFLDLPGEIRNRIYTLVFPEQQVLLRFFHHKKFFKSALGGPYSNSNKRNRQLYAVLVQTIDGAHPNHELVFSAQLLRVCRKIHEETLPLLYTSIALHFESMRAINCFLSGASSQGMEYITKVTITQQGYGEPKLKRDIPWKSQHDQQWLATCKRIAGVMTGIQHLKLCLQISDWPCQLNLSAKWAKPLFFLKGADGLNRVDLYLRSCSFQKERLESAARVMERAMTSECGQAQQQLEKSLQEIAKLERKRCAQPKRRVLKDTTNFACDPGSETVPKVSKAFGVLTIKMNKG